MIGHANAVGGCLRALNAANLSRLRLQRGWICSSRTYASDLKKKGGPITSGSLDRNPRSLKSSGAGTQTIVSPKIVQIRTNATRNPSSADSPAPPQPPPPSDPPSGRGPEKSNVLRNIFIGLLIAAASLGGVYYSGLLDDNKASEKSASKDDKKKKKWTPRPVQRNPKSKDDFPAKIPYVLIGGGTASFAAFRAIKSKDPTAKVLVISAEDNLPYMRPPLSKEVWQQKTLPPTIDKLSFMQWNGQQRSLYYEPSDFYMDIHELEKSPNGGVVIASGWVVAKVDPNSNSVIIEDPSTGTEFPLEYDKCLIATGSMPKNLPIFEKASQHVKDRTVLYRNIRDFENLWNKIQTAKSVAIVGGGFLGSELACSLGRRYKDVAGSNVYQLFKEPGNMGRILPEYLSKWTTNRVSEEGVKVIGEAEVQVVQMDGDQVLLSLSNGNAVRADVVIVAVGSEPCTQLAESSLLEVDANLGGFLVNAELEARTNLYVAGDVACFYDPILGRRRVEHHDHAVVSGRLAGENMAGGTKAYKHQSMFWSDLGPDVGYEAIGIVEAELPTVAVFAKMTEEEKAARAAVERAVKVLSESDPKNSAEKLEENHITADSTDGEININSLMQPSAEANENTSDNVPKETSRETITVSDDKSSEKANSEQDYSKGVIFYLRNEIVVGIVMWNVFHKMHIARQVLSERKKYEDLNEVAKLFNLHEE